MSGDPEMVGAAGIGLTVTVTGADAGLVQPSCVCVTVNVPDALTVSDTWVEPSLHRFPDGAEEVSITLSP